MNRRSSPIEAEQGCAAPGFKEENDSMLVVTIVIRLHEADEMKTLSVRRKGVHVFFVIHIDRDRFIKPTATPIVAPSRAAKPFDEIVWLIAVRAWQPLLFQE
jgi:hypothetical protein